MNHDVATLRGSRRFRRVLESALAILVAFPLACTEGLMPVGPLDDAGFRFRPHFSVGTGAGLRTLPINRVVLTARDAATNAVIVVDTFPVSSEPPYTLNLDMTLPEGQASLSIVVSVELVNFTPPEWAVQWSGETEPLTVQAGASQSAPQVQIFPGPLGNLDVTAISITPSSLELDEGSSASLDAQVEGGSGVEVFWRSLDEDVVTVDDRAGSAARVTGVSSGTARVEAIAGPRTDTARVQVRGRPASIRVSPDSLVLTAIGAEDEFDVDVLDARGNVLSETALVWTIDDTGIAEHLGAGRFRATTAGRLTARVTAGSIETQVKVIVAPRAHGVVVSPPAVTLTAIGGTQTFTAAITDANGHAVTGGRVTWSSSNTAAATIDDAGTATAHALGSTTILATVDGVEGRATLTVTPAPSQITIAPASLTMTALRDTTRLRATAADANGNPVAGVNVRWSSSNGLVATIDESGLLRAEGEGSTVVTAELGTVRGSMTVRVQQSVATVAVVRDSVEAGAVRDTIRFETAARDRNGNTVRGREVRWQSSDQAVATVDATGLATVLAAGRTVITATVDGVSGTGVLRFDAGPKPNLVVAVLTVTPGDTIRSGEDVTLAVRVQNAGASAAGASKLRLAIRDPDTDQVVEDTTFSIPALAGGATFDVAITDELDGDSVPPIVSMMLSAEADIDNAVAESSETDNRANTPRIVLLSPATVTVTPTSISFTHPTDSVRLVVTAYDAFGRVLPEADWYLSTLHQRVMIDGSDIVRAAPHAYGTDSLFVHAGLAQAIVSINVAYAVDRVVILQPDTIRLSAVNDSTGVPFTAYAGTVVVNGQPYTVTTIPGGTPVLDITGSPPMIVAKADGTAKVVLTVGAAADTVVVVVNQVATSVTVTPVNLLTVGTSVNMVATVKDRRGNVLPGVVPVWSVPAGNNIATITNAGVLTGSNPGTVRVTATFGSVSGFTDVSVGPVLNGDVTALWVGENAYAPIVDVQGRPSAELFLSQQPTDGDSWGNPYNWYPASVPDASDNVQVPVRGVKPKLDQDRTVLALTVDASTHINNNGHTLTVLTDALVFGEVQGNGIVSVCKNGGKIRGRVVSQLVVEGICDVDELVDADQITVKDNGHLDLKDKKAKSRGAFKTQGTGKLKMNVAGAELDVTGEIQFAGATGTFTNGKIIARGAFKQVGACGGNAPFAASGSHSVVLEDAGTKQVIFDCPTDSFFNVVEVGSGVTANVSGTARAKGLLTVKGTLGGGTFEGDDNVTLADGGSIVSSEMKVAKTLTIPTSLTSFGAGTVVFDGDADQAIPATTYNKIWVAKTNGKAQPAASLQATEVLVSGGTLDVTQPVTVTTNFRTADGGVLEMDTNVLLDVRGDAEFDGAPSTTLTNGTLKVKGNLRTDAACGVTKFRASGSHKTILSGTSQIIDLECSLDADPSPAGLFASTMVLDDPQFDFATLEVEGQLDLTGDGLIEADSILIKNIVTGSVPVLLKGGLGDVAGLDGDAAWRVNETYVTGNGALPGVVQTNLIVQGTRTLSGIEIEGDLRIETGAVTVDSENGDVTAETLTTTGTGTLNIIEAGAELIVAGSATFGGAETTLTAGRLAIAGAFTQTGACGSATQKAFRASGAHETSLTGTAAQTISFACADTAGTGSKFHRLDVSNDKAVTFSTGAYIGSDVNVAMAGLDVGSGDGEIVVNGSITGTSSRWKVKNTRVAATNGTLPTTLKNLRLDNAFSMHANMTVENLTLAKDANLNVNGYTLSVTGRITAQRDDVVRIDMTNANSVIDNGATAGDYTNLTVQRDATLTIEGIGAALPSLLPSVRFANIILDDGATLTAADLVIRSDDIDQGTGITMNGCVLSLLAVCVY